MRRRRTAHRFGEKRRTTDVLIDEKVDFSGLMLSSDVLEGLKSAGFEIPSPIQLKAIPLGRCGLGKCFLLSEFINLIGLSTNRFYLMRVGEICPSLF